MRKIVFFIVTLLFFMPEISFGQRILFPLKATHSFVDTTVANNGLTTESFDTKNYAKATIFIKLIENSSSDTLYVNMQTEDPVSGRWINIARARPLAAAGDKTILYVEGMLGNTIRFVTSTSSGGNKRYSIDAIFKSKLTLK